jgi:tight adherence protein C
MTFLLLAGGLSCVFVAVTLALLAGGVLEREPTGVARSLAAVEAMQVPTAAEVREQELQRPFIERVLEPAVAWFVRLGRQFTPEDRMARIKRRLDLAGNPAGWDADRLLGVKALAALVGLLFGLVVPPIAGASLPVVLGIMILGGVVGWALPSIVLYQVGYERSEKIRRELPDALDLLTISVESGLAFDAALAQVARKTSGPLAAEFFRVLQEMQIGTGRGQAMRALSERTDVAELKGFVGAMVQADSFGVPVAGVLRVQAKEMRIKRSQRAEEQAQKVPVKILFPLIFCILPCLFIVILGPAVITIVGSFSEGGL